MKAFEAVGETGREALESGLLDLIAGFNRAPTTARWWSRASTSSSSGSRRVRQRTKSAE
jgi:hypothetical protein